MAPYENQYANVWLDGNIYIIEYKEGVVIDLPAAIELIKFRNEITGNQKIKLLVIGHDHSNITAEAKKYFISEENMRNLEKFAFISQHYFGNLQGYAFLKIMSPKLPTRIFRTTNEGLKWLGSQKVMNARSV